MSRIKEWFAEFCVVLETTPRIEYSIAMTGVLPTAMFFFGTWLVASIDISGPYGPMVAAVEGPSELVIATLSLILFVRLVSRVARQYRKARARLYGN